MQVHRNSQEAQRKRNYSNIPMKKRVLLVKLVLKKGIPLAEAVEQLGLKITTARFIINRFKETGTFPRRKFKKSANQLQRPEICKQQFIQSDEERKEIQEEASEENSKEDNEQVQQDNGNLKAQHIDNQMYWVYNPWFPTITPFFY